MDGMELEARPRRPLMLKEWIELESSAELSRDGFSCYPRHLAAELRRSASARRGNGDVMARFSAAVRAALSRTPAAAGREREAAALSRSLSKRLRVGFWKKRSGDEAPEETDRNRPVASCSATAASSGRKDSAASPAMSPRRVSWEGWQVGAGGGAALGDGRRSHETVVKVCKCETTCHSDEEREQRLSPVSVMDFLSQDGDEGNDDEEHGGGTDGRSEDNGASPTFEQSMANIRRASQQLLQRIRRFEQLAEVDTSDVDDATTTTEDASCHVEELDSNSPGGDEDDAEAGRDLLGLPEATSPSPCDDAGQRIRGLLRDFFREGLSSSCQDGRSDDPDDVERSLLETARAWLDGRHGALRSDGKAEVEEIERLGRWRCFGEDEQELLGCDVEGDIFLSLVEELIVDLC